MMEKDSARSLAVDLLTEWEEKQAYSNLLLNQALRHAKLSPRDKGLVTELFYGTIQRLNTIDWVLNQLVKKGVHTLEAWVRQVLRISIYQLLFLDKIPERAVVHEAVQYSKNRSHKGIAGLVNGVLRGFLRRSEALTPPAQPQTHAEQSLTYSFPKWMIQHMEDAYGVTETQQWLADSLLPPQLSVRINTSKISRQAFIELWNQSEKGVARASTVTQDGVILSGSGNPAYSELFEIGYFTIQDESSMLVGEILAPTPDMTVLDMCAAPGGKATHIAQIMENQGKVVACDLHPHKLALIEAHIKRLGFTNVRVLSGDSRYISRKIPNEKFDAILLDAPCSGLGVIRRKPEIKWTKKPQHIEGLVRIQAELLEAAAQLLNPGGTLVYSTCTFEKAENQDQVAAFLKRHPEFEVALEPQLLPSEVEAKAIFGPGWLQILPHHFHSDGFFIARLHKRNDI
ncbi:16S rRNA (cytosine(967)-C(5))-methyltransferase RsmB [Hazenella sp. IB182357]|uniref:16S rRNA (cytosine(967)-C(5))-methyltransferase n=2 Tax=Polycladospora coralii TaxID=2771432 RepID=A0A926N7E0_9BACL|nr:16S rRNA (cytosine(967)-C(5))-methyltransferase RsmB [Polycladospora coralii]